MFLVRVQKRHVEHDGCCPLLLGNGTQFVKNLLVAAAQPVDALDGKRVTLTKYFLETFTLWSLEILAPRLIGKHIVRQDAELGGADKNPYMNLPVEKVMYPLDERLRAVGLYIKYDKSAMAVVRKLSYPSRGLLKSRHEEHVSNGGMLTKRSMARCTEEQMRAAVNHNELHAVPAREIARAHSAERAALCGWRREPLSGGMPA